jgi:hypothetical protein
VDIAPFKFKCRATNVKHSCCYADDKEPHHPSKLAKCIADMAEAMQGMLFHGLIKSPVNSYQIDFSNFDAKWINKAAKIGWELGPLPNLKELSDIPNIRPDALLTRGKANIAVEIEKSNEKTIWFDFIKLLMLIEQNIAHFGILTVPRNYAFRTGTWDLFGEARYYRWCLARFAKVDPGLLSKLAILGYTQEVHTPSGWVNLDDSIIKNIKEQARAHFS